jgi:hypothetical protein
MIRCPQNMIYKLPHQVLPKLDALGKLHEDTIARDIYTGKAPAL